MAPDSFISGLLWYKLTPPRRIIEPDLSSENNFKLRRVGEEKSSLPAQLLTALAALLGALSALSLSWSSLVSWRLQRRLRGVFKGDSSGLNFVGQGQSLTPGGAADWEITLTGLDPKKPVRDIEIRSSTGGMWRSWPDRPDRPACWLVAYCPKDKFERDPNTPKLTNHGGQTHKNLSELELFFEPYSPAPDIAFTVEILYADGTINTCRIPES